MHFAMQQAELPFHARGWSNHVRSVKGTVRRVHSNVAIPFFVDREPSVLGRRLVALCIM